MSQESSRDELIDWNQFSEQFGGDEELITVVGGMFVDCAERLIKTLQEALESGDSKVLETVAHSVKGAVGQVYAIATQALAQSIETRAAAGQASDLADDVAKLMREVMEVKVAIASGPSGV